MRAGEPQVAASGKAVLFVLGMHRSGTSAVTRSFAEAGWHVPDGLLAATDDNPSGYWEPRRMVALNNEWLAAAGSAWFDDRPPRQPADGGPFRARARSLLQQWLAQHATLVLKDPRLCLLYPAWRQACLDLGIQPRVVLVLRDPRAVASSLRRRADNPLFRPAAVCQRSRAMLLWLRYTLEAEHSSRADRRCVIAFERWLERPDEAMAEARRALGLEPARDSAPPAAGAEDGTFQRPPAGAGNAAAWPLRLRHQALDPDRFLPALDEARAALDRVAARYRPLRAAVPQPPEADPWADELFAATEAAGRGRPGSRGSILFVSGEPESRGHVYRVERTLVALRERGQACELATAARCPDPDSLPRHLAAVVIFRAPLDPPLARLLEHCRRSAIPTVFDIDDAVFEPRLMVVESFAYLRRPESRSRDWQVLAQGYRAAMGLADHVVLSTEPLAELARRFHPSVHVVRSGLGPERATARRPEGGGSCLRLGYASGTPTHQADFAVLVEPLAAVLGAVPELRLCIVGALDLTEFPALAPFDSRIERRPLVPLRQLPAELARFDVNLAPLEIGNPFCEGKSELKYFEAGMESVPTIASATRPMAAVIRHGSNGWLARTAEDWERCLRAAAGDAQLRRDLGVAAQHHSAAWFGAEARAESFDAMLDRVLATGPAG